MSAKLPKTIAAYVDAYNARDVKRTVVCFAEDAVVHDEGKVHRGRKAIGKWIETTIAEFEPRLDPGKVERDDAPTVVAVTVSGSFPGNPVSLAFRFKIDDGLIADLDIVP